MMDIDLKTVMSIVTDYLVHALFSLLTMALCALGFLAVSIFMFDNILFHIVAVIMGLTIGGLFASVAFPLLELFFLAQEPPSEPTEGSKKYFEL